MGIKILWKNHYYYVVNVYSSCGLRKKKELWGKLLDLKEEYYDGEWITRGDFNDIKHRGEEREKVKRK